MQVNCLHGYFIFRETRCGEMSRFSSIFGLPLSSQDDYYTFDPLLDAPDYSIAGNLYLEAPALKTFEGKPWEIMEKNGLVYNFNTELIVPIESVTQLVEIKQASNYFLSDGLILPGSVTDDGSRVTDYSAWFYFDLMKFKYTEIDYE